MLMNIIDNTSTLVCHAVFCAIVRKNIVHRISYLHGLQTSGIVSMRRRHDKPTRPIA